MTWADFDILKTSGPLNGLVKQNSVEHWSCCLRKENNFNWADIACHIYYW
jgi:hypothetical protein